MTLGFVIAGVAVLLAVLKLLEEYRKMSDK